MSAELTNTVEGIFLKSCFNRLNEALAVSMVGHHLGEACCFIGSADPQHHLQLLIHPLE